MKQMKVPMPPAQKFSPQLPPTVASDSEDDLRWMHSVASVNSTSNVGSFLLSNNLRIKKNSSERSLQSLTEAQKLYFRR